MQLNFFSRKISLGLLPALCVAFLGGCTAHTELTMHSRPNTDPHAKVLKVTPVRTAHVVKFRHRGSSFSGHDRKMLINHLRRQEDLTTVRAQVATRFASKSHKAQVYMIKRLLLRCGIPERNIFLTFGSEMKKKPWPHVVSVTFVKYGVTLPPCPDWAEPVGQIGVHQFMSNYGCAKTTNLGLMVSDPYYLVKSDPLGQADGSALGAGTKSGAVGAMARYRDGMTKEFVKEEKIDAGS